MTTPIIKFVKNYIDSKGLRLHMPGHKGKSLLGFEEYDLTEIDGADVLYHADGIIKESMDNASCLFKSAKTVYSAEGSSLSIRAMLYLAVLYAKEMKKRPTIFAGRNAHKVFVMSAALLDFDIHWLYGRTCGDITECMIAPDDLENELNNTDELPVAVYITSPDYLGNIADIAGISAVCRKYGILLICDNAHGAYLNFLPSSLHPISLGADLCCDSAHKTLPALTGAGYLHISADAPHLFFENAEKAMSLFASTSPSYLILQSLDAVNAYICDGYREKLCVFIQKLSELKKKLSDAGISNRDLEPLKITLTPKLFGYTGTELNGYLRKNGIVCEFYDTDYLVLMLTPENTDEELDKIYRILAKLEKKEPLTKMPPCIPRDAQRAVSVREAVISRTEKLPAEQCVGRIFAGINAACPPAIPIVVCGEVITKKTVELLGYYGEHECEVLIC